MKTFVLEDNGLVVDALSTKRRYKVGDSIEYQKLVDGTVVSVRYLVVDVLSIASDVVKVVVQKNI